jgi:hypothetical protein
MPIWAFFYALIRLQEHCYINEDIEENDKLVSEMNL